MLDHITSHILSSQKMNGLDEYYRMNVTIKPNRIPIKMDDICQIRYTLEKTKKCHPLILIKQITWALVLGVGVF